MNYTYKRIMIYYKKNEKIIFLPTGESLTYGGETGIEPAIELSLPISKDKLIESIKQTFDLCWTKSIEINLKEQSVIEKILKYKSYKKVVENFELFQITFYEKENKFWITKTLKSKNLRSYEGRDFEYNWNFIDFDFILNLIQNEQIS